MQKSTIVIALSIILLAAGVGGLYIQFQMQYASLADRYNQLEEKYSQLSEAYYNLAQLVSKQHFQRSSARVLVYAMDLGGVMIEHGNKIIEALTQDSRITAVLARNQDDLTLENLETNFDVVVLYQHNALNQTSLISRDRILDVINFAESGHMIVAVHHGIYDPNRDNPDPRYNIIPLTDYIGGYLWDVSTSRKPPLLDGVEDNILVVVNSTHYLTEGISNFTIANDEVYYAMVTSPNITAVINNRDYGPFVWSQGKYAVYIQIGHFPTDFDHPMVRRILQNAVLHIPMTG